MALGPKAVDAKASPYAAVLAAPFGTVGIRVADDAVTGIDYLPMDRATMEPTGALARETARQIRAYLKNPSHAFDVPCRVNGTVHQRAVWQGISAIPSGRTLTYGELARRLGSGARAVGAACGSNPIPIIVPCHRVVAAGGGLGGFMHSRAAFSLDIKRWLLAHEAG